MALPVPSGEIEKTPTANTSVNKPSSGTFGEKAELSRLRQSLPATGNTQTGATGPAFQPQSVTALPAANPQGRPVGPAGVPSALLRPSDRPGVPVNTPLAQPQAPLGGAQTGQQARLALLDALAQSNEVSAETRAWAKEFREALTRGV